MALRERDIPRFFAQSVGKNVEQSIPLSTHSYFRIGGNADYFFTASSSSDLLKAVHFAIDRSLPYYVIGGGTNLLFDDRGFRGLIIKNSTRGIKRKEEEHIEVLSGTALEELIHFCSEEDLSGLEFLAGIPGSVGGAVYGNAGAFNREIGSSLKEAVLLRREGDRITVSRDYFSFGYRYSALRRTHEILLKATFALRKGNREEIKARIEKFRKKREKRHPPMNVACAGSYFKNPIIPDGKKVPAAQLLDNIGAKDLKIGGAEVFSGHANFIINAGSATAKDVLELADALKKRVKKKFNVELEEEVIYLPAEPS
jgi:UDP-N-acetylmuramate dehydrogenase